MNTIDREIADLPDEELRGQLLEIQARFTRHDQLLEVLKRAEDSGAAIAVTGSDADLLRDLLSAA